MPSIFLAKSNDSSLEVYSIVKHVLGLWVAQDESSRSVLEWEKDKDYHKNTDILLIIPPENGLNTDEKTVTVGRGVYDFVADRSSIGRGYDEVIIVTSLTFDGPMVGIGCHQLASRTKIPGKSWKTYGEFSLRNGSYFGLCAMLNVRDNCLPASLSSTDWNMVNGAQYSTGVMDRQRCQDLRTKLTSLDPWVEDEDEDDGEGRAWADEQPALVKAKAKFETAEEPWRRNAEASGYQFPQPYQIRARFLSPKQPLSGVPLSRNHSARVTLRFGTSTKCHDDDFFQAQAKARGEAAGHRGGSPRAWPVLHDY